MSMDSRAFLTAFVILAMPPIAAAQTEPIIVEAESASISSAYSIGTAEGATYVTIVNDSPGFGPPTTADGALTYSVTFPSAGNYDLYARFRVGPGGGSDDSFYVGNGFGDKVGTSQWVLLNQIDGGGFTAPSDTVRNGGPATTNVFKWFRITGFGGPATWTVPDGALTQTFSAGGRETGNFIDKFAFGRQGSWYTVNNLDTGSAATGTPPPPPPPPYTPPGPPIATGKPKYLGSAHSPAQTANFAAYWNQVTPENGGKWATVEGTRDVMNWTQADAAYQMARTNGFTFKWHVLFWGNQQPEWLQNLPPAEQLEEIHEWLAAIAARYPDLEQIEVVNEPLHDPPQTPANTPPGQSCGGCGNYYDALGGAGATGWDWIISAFTLARQYFPSAKLMLNDYSITNDRNATENYLGIIKLLKARGLIDLVGIQGHAFSTTEAAPMPNFRANLDYLANKSELPIYVTELDIDGNDDQVQLAGYQKIFPVFWEHPAVHGVTLWGYRPGHWRTAQGAWLTYENGAERPAIQWLQRYVRNNLAEIPYQWFSVARNAAAGTVVGTAQANDADSEQAEQSVHRSQITRVRCGAGHTGRPCNVSTGAVVITFRDMTVAALSITATVAFAASNPKVMGSVAVEWNDVPVKQEEVRAVRQFFRAPTATLNELELHVTTLPAGATSHAPHKHPNEELVIVKEGTVEVLVDGQMKRVGPGSVVFNASNQMHSLRNVGDGPATYHVINWTTTATPK